MTRAAAVGYLALLIVGTITLTTGAAVQWGWAGGLMGFGLSCLLTANGEAL